ncbi:BTAD domain-containing putative transcriptional regulator [Actinoplanes sp. NPDC051851]|uniref:AfsR/SARP family transcriptional regulator n=1 Tax=Actinoplanes sp. NPDC051851 TaxID=3154753 RepID=UPI00342AB662
MPDLRFRVLGRLGVERDRQPVALGPIQQQVVLGILLLHGGRPLGVPQIIDAVWGDAAPASAVNLVQRHVSGLRRALEPRRAARAAESRLHWTGTGYRLAVEDAEVDLAAFDAEVRRARSQRETGDRGGAAARLAAALGLWRGPLCDGLGGPFLDAERDRLAGRRLTVVRERIELDLSLAPDAAALVEELCRLCDEHPLHEPLYELLMRALLRSGRRSEALDVFQLARRRLRGDLGVEPAATLQQLHREALGGSRAEPGIPAAARRIGVPAQLPRALPDFVERVEPGTQLDRALAEEGAVVALVGTAGVGKSTLAVAWAHRVRDRFPDGQLHVNLHGFDPSTPATDPGRVIRGFLEALAVPAERIGADVEGQAALYRSTVAGRRILILLDNALDAEQVRPLLPGAPGCLVLITSRNELLSLVAIDGARPVRLDLMNPDEARHLIARRLGRRRVDAEPDAVTEIIAGCARLPLALSVVTARAAAYPQFSLSATAGELRRVHGRLDLLDAGDTATNVRAVFACSYRGLSPSAARLFRLLGLQCGPELPTAAMTGLVDGPVRPQLAELARAHLIAERVPGRYVLHDLLRAYAAELAVATEPADERRAAIRAVLDHHRYAAYVADRALNPFRDDPIDPPPAPAVPVDPPVDHRAAMAWFAAEEPVLLTALRQAADEGLYTHAWQLAWALTQFLNREGHWHDAVAAQEVALTAARRLGDARAEAVVRGCLAYAYIRLRRFDEARAQLHRALPLFERCNEPIGMGHVHRALTWVADCEGRYRDAFPHIHEALRHFRAAGHRTGEARALNALGWFHSRLGEHREALVHCAAALSLMRAHDDRYDQADVLDSLGRAHHELGHHAEAASCYAEAVELYEEFADHFCEGQALVALGEAHAAAGAGGEAVRAWTRAVDVFEALGLPDADDVRHLIKSAPWLSGG